MHEFKKAGTFSFTMTISNQTCETSYEGKIYIFNTAHNIKVNTNTNKTVSKPAGTTGVKQDLNKKDNISIKVYPNPIQTSATISFEVNNSNQTTNIQLLDITGRTVQVMTNQTYPEGQHRLNLDRNDMPAGTYYVKVQTGKNVSVKPVIFQ